MSGLGIVIIGRNEGERLRRCLQSVAMAGCPVVYVDSGSSDGSMELAGSLGAGVVNLDLSTPFTAARARNEGFRRLMELRPGLQFVQFVDGDCELSGGWLSAAQAEMRNRPEAAALCGLLRERHPEASIYNRLCDLQWNGPAGQIEACGGIAMSLL
jgi:glycosyltransferase involved in cell wall biosynthesis